MMRTSMFGTMARLGAAAVVLMAPVACGDKDPAAPALVATANVVAPVTAATYGVIAGEAFTIPNGGGALSPALAGQTVQVTFGGSTTQRTATIVVDGSTVVADVDFGSCIFRVTSAQMSGQSWQVLSGDILTINPCAIELNTAGRPSGASGAVNATLRWGSVNSNPRPVQVTIGSDGQVTVTKGGTTISVGTVTLTPVTGS